MIKTINKLIINKVGRDLTEYISSNTMNSVVKRVNPFIWTYDLKALVLDKQLESSDVITLTLLPNQHWKAAKAGQFIEIKLLIEGKEYRDSYVISSLKDNIIKIKISKNSKVSNWLYEYIKIGMSLAIYGPFDELIFNHQKDNLQVLQHESNIIETAKPESVLPTVYFKQYNKKIQLKEDDVGKSLLQLGIENGLNLERGCKKGICGTCKLILHEGSVEGNTLGKAVYICSAFPSSDLVVLGT